MGKISQIIKLFKEDHNIPTFTEEMTRPYRYEFMQAMTQEIK